MSRVWHMGMMKAQARRLLPLPRVKLGWELYLFAGLALVALGLRVWELGGRTMHYDESLHLHYAWRLAVGEGYSHSPWMHGPFQVNLTALIFKMFSDSDFTARFGYALFGSALVFLPYFLRTYLGRTGAVLTAIMLALSPSLLYMSRFGRNEILMAFFAVALLTLMWRYLNEGKDRYLYMASAVLALTFASKETSYIVVAIFAGTLFLLSLAELIPLVLGRIRLSEMRGAPAFLILLVTMSLPQWSALASIPLGGLGLELESVGVGENGAAGAGPALRHVSPGGPARSRQLGDYGGHRGHSPGCGRVHGERTQMEEMAAAGGAPGGADLCLRRPSRGKRTPGLSPGLCCVVRHLYRVGHHRPDVALEGVAHMCRHLLSHMGPCSTQAYSAHLSRTTAIAPMTWEAPSTPSAAGSAACSQAPGRGWATGSHSRMWPVASSPRTTTS